MTATLATISALLSKTVANGCTPEEAESAYTKARELVAVLAKPPALRVGRKKLDAAVLKAIKPGERVYDTELPAFFASGLSKGGVSFSVLADQPSNKRAWDKPRTLVRVVRHEDGTPARWPDTVNLREARTLAKEHLASIKKGVDPRPNFKTPIDGWTVQDAYDDYVNSYIPTQGLPDSSKRTYGYNFKRLVDLGWHKRKMREAVVDVDGLTKLHEAIRLGVIAKTKNRNDDTGKNAADASINFLAILANYARGKDPTLPAWIPRAVNKHGQRERSDDGMGLKECGAWWQGVKTVRNPQKRFLGLFMFATGLREEDAMTATGENFKEAERTLFVPEPKGHRDINKKKFDRSFTIPLSDLAMHAILSARAAQKIPSTLLFPSRGNKPFADSMLVRGDVRFADGHKLRHTFTTILEDLGVDEPTRARLLNHKPKTETAAYSNRHKVTAPLRAAVDLANAAIMKEIQL